MARNQTYIDAPPERVFYVLADPDSYGHWVVGSNAIHDADAAWPAVGTAFRHTVATGPFKTSDLTTVERVSPRRLTLHASANPYGAARVTIELQPVKGGTRVTLIEDPAELRARLFFTPLGHLLVRLRNAESLRRLRRLAETA
jgi:uncharacterized protein YndB with AHSA1/START domain